MSEKVTYGQKVSLNLCQELREFQKQSGLTGEEFLMHLLELYKREQRGEFEDLAIKEIAVTTATELQGTSKQIAELSASAHNLLTQLYRSKDIALEIVETKAQLKLEEDKNRTLEKKLAETEQLMLAMEHDHTKEIDNLQRQHALDTEQKVLKQRKEFQDVLSANSQKHHQEIQLLIEKLSKPTRWSLFKTKKKSG